MDREIEEYLRGVHLPEYKSPRYEQDRQESRREILDKMERRQQMASRKKTLRIICVLAALVCVSALVIAGTASRKWLFKGTENGAYVFTTQPEKTQKDGKEIYNARTSMIMSNDPDFTMSPSDIEQAQRDLEETDLLRQQDKRELVKVIETEVEGEVGRTYIYKYVLADGREDTVGENDPDEEVSRKVLSLDVKEIFTLRKEGKGDLLDPKEVEVKGKIFIFERYRITLSDGTEIIHSIGVPKEQFRGREKGVHVFTTQKDGKAVSTRSNDPDFTQKDAEEIDLLRQQDKRELTRVIEIELEGEVHRVYSYKYVLADGREKTIGENDPDEEVSRKVLSLDVKEIYALRYGGKGEFLDPEEVEVKGKVFVFERCKIMLSDGSQVIHSIGTPKKKE